MASKKKKKPAAKKTAKKAASKKPTGKKTAKKAAKKTTKKAAKKTAKNASSKKPAEKAAKKPAKKAAKKPAAKKPAAKKKKKAASKEPARHALQTTSEALDQHVLPAKPKKKALDLASLAASYQGGDATAHAVTTEQMDQMKDIGLRGDGEILNVEDEGDVAPCRLVDHGEGRFSLCLDDFKMPQLPLFDERGLQGGGYTWEAIADSLLRLRRPDLVDQVAWDSEAGMFVAVGNRANLVALARLIQDVLAHPDALKAAVDAADPDRLE